MKRALRPAGFLLLLTLALAACSGGDGSDAGASVRGADDVQIVGADEASDLLEEGQDRLKAEAADDAESTTTSLAVTESGRSFQTRLGTALTVFNTCMQEEGYTFVGIPGQTDDPVAAEPEYLNALIACNNESGIGAVMQEQGQRQQNLTADQKKSVNESGRQVFGCLIDRGWDLGDLEANANGILSPTRFPAVPSSRQDEFNRDLDECGWNDLELG